MSGLNSFTFSSAGGLLYSQATNVKRAQVPTLGGPLDITATSDISGCLLVPTLGVLKPGVVTVTESEGAVRKFFVSSGSVTVNPDLTVQLLADEAFDLTLLDADCARLQLDEARQLFADATGAAQKAEAQIAVETAEAILNALQPTLPPPASASDENN